MAYQRQTFTDGKTKLKASHLKNMEDGIIEAQEAADSKAGKKTASGGEIFGDYGNNQAGELGSAFGEKSKALGYASMAQGSTIFRSGSEYITNSDGLVYVVSGDCELATSKGEGGYEVITQELLEILIGYSCIKTSDGGFVPASDLRTNESIGTASKASGMGAVAYSRGSKSLGYRTQTGYPPSAEEVAKRKEVLTKTDANGNVIYPVEHVGQAAVAIGSDTVAVENNSFAGGYKSQALAPQSFAFGGTMYDGTIITRATGQAATAIGSGVVASGFASFATGANTDATGDYSHAEGSGTVASNICSHAEGGGTTASGRAAHAEGELTKAIGDYSHAEGYNTEASGTHSHTEGNYTKAIGNYCHAEGERTEASNYWAHAEGHQTKASGRASHAEGNSTEAIGLYTHAEGYSTKAIGNYSHTEGEGTVATGRHSHIQGKYNDADVKRDADGNMVDADGNITTDFTKAAAANKYAHIVGNGSSTKRSNAYTLDWQGNGAYAGAISSTTGADYAEYFEWEDGNPDNEDRVGYVVTLDGEKIKKATSTDDILGIISGTAAVIGDTAEWNWTGKFLTDKFGRPITEEVEQFVDEPKEVLNEETGKTEIVMEKVSIGFITVPKINPEYDASKPYINRKERPEWGCVGMFGKLYARDDGTCQVNGYAKVGVDGKLTVSDTKTNMRVLSRVNDAVIRVLLR